MELELDLHPRWNWIGLLAVIAVAMVAIGALGRAVTPQGEKLLTWSEWQVRQARQAYLEELDLLRQDAEKLSGLLANTPDPVRAQLAAGQVAEHTSEGQAALTVQRAALAEAALFIQEWAMGAGEYEPARAALEQAIALLTELEEP